MHITTPLALKGATALLFWLAIFLIQKLNWGLGGGRALVLLALLIAACCLTIGAQRAAPAFSASGSRVIAAFVAVLVIAQIVYAAARLAHPHLIDVATTTLAAGKVLLAGGNPYLVPLDPRTAGDGMSFAGYKYPPAMALAYLPLGAPLAERGVQLTNLLLQLGVVWAMIRVASEIGSRLAGLIAAALYLSLPLLPFQLFAKGVTDLAAVLPLLIALVLSERHAVLAGLCVGLSLSAKPLPGALLVPICLPATGRARLSYGAGIALGLVPSLVYLAWSPAALWQNVVLFNLVRPIDSTSWLFLMPSAASVVLRAAWLALYLAVTAYVWRARPALAARCGLAVILMLATMLSGPASHDNYQLWWLPFFAVLLGLALAGAPAPEPAPSALPKSRLRV